MPVLSGSISDLGATIHVKVMQSNERVAALKKAGLKFSPPRVVLGLIDTGASMSVIDTDIVNSLGLSPHGIVSVHTPSTGAAYLERQAFDALVTLGGTAASKPLSRTIQVVELELASEGFLALIGRDILKDCRLVYDGPANSFTLEYAVP